jgi:hypothetical protein
MNTSCCDEGTCCSAIIVIAAAVTFKKVEHYRRVAGAFSTTSTLDGHQLDQNM